MAARGGSDVGCGSIIAVLFGLALVAYVVDVILKAVGAFFAFLIAVLPAAAVLALVGGLGWWAVTSGARYLAPEARLRRREAATAKRLAGLQEAGQFGEFVEACACMSHGEQRLLAALDSRLGRAAGWTVGGAMRDLARELLHLEQARRAATSADLPAALTDGVAAEARAIANRVWKDAGRVAAVALDGVPAPSRLSNRLGRVRADLERLAACVRETRADLAELTLSGMHAADATLLRGAEERLRAASAGWRWLSGRDDPEGT
jgi:hypothetical protein